MGGEKQAWRHHLSLPLGNTFPYKAEYFPDSHMMNYSVIPKCTTEHIESSSNTKEIRLILKF